MEPPDIETSSEDYARRFGGPVGEYFLEVQERLCFDLLGSWSGCRILDVGGGHGQLAIPLAAAGYDVTVQGSSPACNDRLSRLGAFHSVRVSFVTGELLNLPFPDQSYDVVISIRLISHVDRWDRLIRELTRVARHAVLIDYPSLVGFNMAVPLLFRLKKGVEKNTRAFLCFTKGQISEGFLKHGFVLSAAHPEFFLPMALHRALGSLAFSTRSEDLFRVVGGTQLLGSPVLALAERKPNHQR